MRLIINGEPRDLKEGLTVAALLDALELDGRRLGVERNLSIVPKSAYAATALGEGDVIEIVHFVGGG
ncbi:MAG TPA: thiamine biosynthesis protein ThiS [Parvularcula sp.]|nr:thiamine biosynthesis protein ThiS [Parvularcula sp.]HBS32728.1 thiamine biosynthesis protein ThiS [Parvularcula sp.]